MTIAAILGDNTLNLYTSIAKWPHVYVPLLHPDVPEF